MKILRDAETDGDFTSRLAWIEEGRTLPVGAVWDEYCLRADVPVGGSWISAMRQDEQVRLRNR